LTSSWGSAGTNNGPAPAEFDNELYAGWRGITLGKIFCSVYDGLTWTSQAGLPDETGDPPALVANPLTGGLFLVWTTSSQQIDYIYCLGTSAGACSGPVNALSGPTTNGSPALAFMGGDSGTLYIAWKGPTGDNIGYEASIDNANFTPQDPDVALRDIDMPGIDDLAAAGVLAQEVPECRSLSLTTFGRPGYPQRAMESGACVSWSRMRRQSIWPTRSGGSRPASALSIRYWPPKRSRAESPR
jgi:CheY-like chemotaxis protein